MLSFDTSLTLLPPVSSPYYIVTPPYMRTSAGVRVMHLVANALRIKGYAAYILPQFLIEGRTPVHPELKTEILTSEIAEMHFHEGRTPIVIYPEITAGNPLEADVVVRYILNFPGLLGGPSAFSPNDYLLYYSQDLIPQNMEIDQNLKSVLFVPTSDPRIFFPPQEGSVRNKKIFYAGKHKKYQGGDLSSVTKDCIEITIGQPNSQTRPQLVKLFQEATVFYTYENTALALEAVLCGCPVVLLNENIVKNWIAKTELTAFGITTENTPESIARAKEETKLYRENYMKTFDLFWSNLDIFIKQSQELASLKTYSKKIKFKVPKNKPSLLVAGLRAIHSYRHSNGSFKLVGLLLGSLQGKKGMQKLQQELRKEFVKIR